MIDRHHEDMDEDKLLNAHSFLWNSMIKVFEKHTGNIIVDEIKKEQLNELLEYERELAFREKERG